MTRKLLALILTVLSVSVHAQKKVDASKQVAFVYFEHRKTNLIVIPNIDKLYSFKIYRKAKTDTTFVQVGEKQKPPLPMRYNISPYSVTWEDKEYNTTEVDYKILSFDKAGKEICELKVMWEKQSSKDKHTVDGTR